MCSGVVPQQPPTIADAVALDELAAASSASGSGFSGKIVSPSGPCSGRPAFGMQWTGSGRVLAEEADRVAHVLGPGRAVEPDHVDVERVERRQHRLDVGAEQHLAAVRQQRDAESGSAACGRSRLNASRAPKIAALTSRMSCAVSMMIRSAPPSTRPRACSAKTSTSSPKVMLPEGRVVGGGQEAGRADRAGDEAVLARRLAGDLGGLGVDLERVLAEAPLLELQARALEGVGLDAPRRRPRASRCGRPRSRRGG